MQEFEKATKRGRKEPRIPPETEDSSDRGDSDVDVPARKKVSGWHHIWLEDESRLFPAKRSGKYHGLLAGPKWGGMIFGWEVTIEYDMPGGRCFYVLTDQPLTGNKSVPVDFDVHYFLSSTFCHWYLPSIITPLHRCKIWYRSKAYPGNTPLFGSIYKAWSFNCEVTYVLKSIHSSVFEKTLSTACTRWC